MTGRLIYLMGPSGSGKDTLLHGLSCRMGQNVYLAPRLITRPPTGTELRAISVSTEEFLRLERSGHLAMSWRANGLAYGVRADIDDRLRAGCDVLVNGSRAYLPEARRRYPDLVAILLTVEAEALRRRLVARGRETEDQIRRRMDRNVSYLGLSNTVDAGDMMVLDNSGRPEDAIQKLHQYLNSTDTGIVRDHAADTFGYRQRRAGSRL